jgi:hypothetical protein
LNTYDGSTYKSYLGPIEYGSYTSNNIINGGIAAAAYSGIEYFFVSYTGLNNLW